MEGGRGEEAAMNQTDALISFRQQLTEAFRFDLPPRSVYRAEDLMGETNLAWKTELKVQVYLEDFLVRYPHLVGSPNLPNIRKAIRTDLISKGVI